MNNYNSVNLDGVAQAGVITSGYKTAHEHLHELTFIYAKVKVKACWPEASPFRAQAKAI